MGQNSFALEDQLELGWREWVALPQLSIPAIKAKIDTGAKTSALHAFQVETFKKRGLPWVRFGIHPLRRRRDLALFCESEVIDERMVSDSGGHREQRIVICTPVRIGENEWPIEISLTNREDMLFRMLLGRTAMHKGIHIYPAKSFLAGRKLARSYSKK